jgi:16S rRNA (uracil1498-N3)-methyltransferase
MRRSVGDAVRLFNGRDGEWNGRIAAMGRGKASIAVDILVRSQAEDGDPWADIWLMFAVLKRDQTDLVVQKATELGVSTLLPVFTERTNAARVNARSAAYDHN